MRKLRIISLSPLVLLALCRTSATSRMQEKQYLRLVQTIPLPNVKGRLKHLDIDVKKQTTLRGRTRERLPRGRRLAGGQMVEKHFRFSKAAWCRVGKRENI